MMTKLKKQAIASYPQVQKKLDIYDLLKRSSCKRINAIHGSDALRVSTASSLYSALFLYKIKRTTSSDRAC